MDKNFLAWYFTSGLKGYLRLWGNYRWFALHFFNVRTLLRTLFSPWKKSLVPKDWQGWNPLQSIQLAVVNFVFRIYGAIARLVVVAVGLFFYLLVIVIGAIFLAAYLAWPVFFVATVYLGAASQPQYFIFSVVLAVYFVFIISSYRRDHQVSLPHLSFDQLVQHPVFERVIGRLGLPQEESSYEKFLSETQRKEILAKLNLSEAELNYIVTWEIFSNQKEEEKRRPWDKNSLRTISPVGKYWQYGNTALLDRYCTDITNSDRSEYGDLQLIHHEKQFRMLQLVLEKPNENCAILLGEPGVGKRGIIHFLAKIIRENQIANQNLADKRVLLIDLGAALSSASGENLSLPDFVHRLFFEAAYAGNVILVLEGLEHFLGSSSSQFALDLTPALEEYLAYPSFQLVATITPSKYYQAVERNKNILRYFEVIDVPEMSETEAMEVLLERFAPLEQKRIIFTYPGLKNLVRRSTQIADAVKLPKRALDLATELLLFWKDHPSSSISAALVDDFISVKSGLPVGQIKESEKDLLMNLEPALHRRVVGQDEAIKQIAQAIRKARSGISGGNRPIGSFLFLGPTGVGKTEAAKSLAEAYFGNDERMIRMDMSEFQGAGALEAMIGSKASGEPGRLVSQAKNAPFSLLLLDEIEKASQNVLDLFLQILDEGHVTDAFGEKVSFKNMVIIATSNAGSSLIKEGLDKQKSTDELRKEVLDQVVSNGTFRLEFLNRFDGVVFFKPLTEQELGEIVKIKLALLANRVKKEKNISVVFDDDIVPQVLARGYEPMFGARSINRYISDSLEDLIARKIIDQSFRSGNEIKLSAKDIGGE